MTDLDWGEIITVFILSAVKLGIAALPTAFALNFTFLETLIICSSGGIFGVLLFTFLIGGIIKLVNSFMERYFPHGIKNPITIFLDKFFPNRKRPNKMFNRKNRFIIRSKRSFGIIGIAIISPVILSIPLGVFLALKFFKDKRKIIFWMSLSVVFWTITLFLVFNIFHSTFT